nr:heme-binding protein [Tissierella sp.]
MGKYETLEYEVLIKDKEYEIREYRDFYIVEYDNGEDFNSNKGFGVLFKYISSDNKEDQKISMTTPVIQEVREIHKKIAFVVPQEFGDNIPHPNNPNLKIEKFHTGIFAVIRYSGLSNESKEKNKKNKLESWLRKNGYTKRSNYMLAFYNPPFTLPMFRRNEIWIRVSK